MKLVVGLGNPGKEYERTRHNVGFRVIDEVARRWRIEVSRRKFSSRVGGGTVGRGRVLLLKPTTYMNRSGQSVIEAVAFYKVPLEDLLVVTDDLALPLGRLRIRPRGSAGGHKGLGDIIGRLGTDGFARLRVGIEWAGGPKMVDHVLSPFGAQEQEPISQAVRRAADAVTCWVDDGVDTAMNTFNRSQEPGGESRPDRDDGTQPSSDGGMQP